MWAKIFSWLWLLLFISLGILALYHTPIDNKNDLLKIKEEMDLSIWYINTFQKSNKRIPTELEFKKWQHRGDQIPKNISDDSLEKIIDNFGLPRIEYFPNAKAANISKTYPVNIDWDNNYAIDLVREDGDGHYTSWNEQYSVDTTYNQTGSVLFLIIMLFIGFIPFVIHYYKKRYSVDQSSVK